MSIPVEVDRLGAALAGFGTGYLLSTADGRVKVVSVAPVLVDGVLRVAAPGRGTLANVAANATVTVLYPPLDAPGHCLLVDGDAAADGADVVVTPTAAVLHRPVGQA